jgi:hypothetical protein
MMNDRNDFTKKERVGGGMSEGPVDESYARFLKNLLKERESLDPEKYPATLRIVQSGKRRESNFDNLSRQYTLGTITN